MRRASMFVACSLLACASADARVIELHRNAGFDRDIDGVTVVAPSGGSATWNAADLTGDANSGALLLTGPAGLYQLSFCTLPEQQLKPIRQFYEFSVRASGGAGSSMLHEGFFNWYSDTGLPCDGALIGWLRRYSSISATSSSDASIAAGAWPGLSVVLQVTKADAGPLLIDDWSVRVDEDLIFRDDDQPATVFSL